jgi:hypothetical protein
MILGAIVTSTNLGDRLLLRYLETQARIRAPASKRGISRERSWDNRRVKDGRINVYIPASVIAIVLVLSLIRDLGRRVVL